LLGWIYVFNSYPNPQARYDAFQLKLFLGLNLSFINLALMGLAILSILLSAAFKNGFIRSIIMFINIAFLIFVLWQHL
jgi:uncharacterized membrane protein YqjE